MNDQLSPQTIDLLTRLAIVMEDLEQIKEVTAPDWLDQVQEPTSHEKSHVRRSLGSICYLALEALEMVGSWEDYKRELRSMGVEE